MSDSGQRSADDPVSRPGSAATVIGGACTSGDAADPPDDPPAPAPDAEASTELLAALRDAGVDLAGTPGPVLDLDERTFCGSDVRVHGVPDVGVAQRCFLDHHIAESDAVYVTTSPTTEGDPITSVYVTGRNGSVTLFSDTTRDEFGNGGWWRSDARRLAVRSSPDAPTIELLGSTSVELDAALPATVDDPLPDWFRDRDRLRWCGMDVRIEDQSMDARRCFGDAVAAGDPAEYVVGSTGDEGELGIHWYRVLGPGEFEVVTRSLPGAPPTDQAPPSWQRQRCSRIDALHEPGSEVDLLPVHEYFEPCAPA